jgi:hypothetical protein
MDPVAEKLFSMAMYAVCAVAFAVVAIFSTATVRAYRNGQISRDRLVGTLIFLLGCVAVPVLLLFAFYPRPP